MPSVPLTSRRIYSFRFFKEYGPWLAISVVIFLTVIVSLPLLEVPFQRDEGGYAYTAQLLLSSPPPYGEVYAVRLSGIFLAYSLILAILGPTSVGINLGLLVVNAANVLLVFLLGKKLLGDLVGILAGTSYAALTLSISVLGFWAETEHFVLLPAMGGSSAGTRKDHKTLWLHRYLGYEIK